MKNQVTVIICNTRSECFWGLSYIKSHPNSSVVFLTPSLESQNILISHHIPADNLYLVEPFESNDDAEQKKSIYKQALHIMRTYQQRAATFNLTAYGHNFITLHADNLMFMYTDILHAYKIYQNLVIRWGKIQIFVPATSLTDYVSGTRDRFYSLAHYITHYFRHPSITVVSYTTKSTPNNRIGQLVFWLKAKKSLLRPAFLTVLYILRHGPTPHIGLDPKKPTVIMQTGGLITAYYYKLYTLLAKEFNFILITYKLQLYQQLPLLRLKIPFLKLTSLWKPEWKTEQDQEEKQLTKKIGLFFRQKTATASLNYKPDLSHALANQTEVFLRKNLKKSLQKIILNSYILNKYQPQLVINSHDPSITGASFVLPARSLDIPSLLLLHGLPGGKTHPDLLSDFIAVWGPETKNYFVNNSRFNLQTIFTTGFPKIDEYSDFFRSRIQKKPQINNYPSPLKLGLLLTSYHPNDAYQSRFLRELLTALSTLSHPIRLNYRYHEGFPITGIETIITNNNMRVKDCSLQPLERFTEENNIIISNDTTAILWAMFSQKPLFHINPNWSTPLLPTQKYHAAWHAKDSTDFINQFCKLLQSPQQMYELIPGQKKFLEDFAGPLDAHASERLLTCIRELIVKKGN